MSPRTRRIGIAIAVALCVGIASVTVLSFTPVPRHAMLYDRWVGAANPGCGGIGTLRGISVSFHWWDAVRVHFVVVACSSTSEVFESNGTNGSGGVTSSGGELWLGALCPSGPSPGECMGADVSVNYSAPFLQWPG